MGEFEALLGEPAWWSGVEGVVENSFESRQSHGRSDSRIFQRKIEDEVLCRVTS